MLVYFSCLVVWNPLFLDPSDGVFGRFDLAALCGCCTLNVCLFVCIFELDYRMIMDSLPIALSDSLTNNECLTPRPNLNNTRQSGLL